ncbi:hypothetical protein DN745_10600 [Bradymonas sediminis]|uniref:Uncharacterized protein n=1 Tax=Bradymonas sediminis TaxID=1548548 RepID=A0A2Z4FLC7_9DELT|nr:hypothetical protein DN745_10600 [Bradymonas sediminis]
MADYNPYVLPTFANGSTNTVVVVGYTGCTPGVLPSINSCEASYFNQSGNLTLSALGTQTGERLTGELSELVMDVVDSEGETSWCIDAFDFDLGVVSNLPAPGECRVDVDCGGSSCFDPEEARRFAMCPPQSCNPDLTFCLDDASCGAGGVCRPAPMEACACSPEMPTCQPACLEDMDCETGEACGDDGHCGPIPCQGLGASPDCPAHYSCTVDNICERTTCMMDDDCVDGRCVEGRCYESFGACASQF